MNFQFRRECAHGGKCLSGPKFAADEGLLRGEHHLVEDGLARAQAQPEQCHSCTVTQVIVSVNAPAVTLRSALGKLGSGDLTILPSLGGMPGL